MLSQRLSHACSTSQGPGRDQPLRGRLLFCNETPQALSDQVSPPSLSEARPWLYSRHNCLLCLPGRSCQRPNCFIGASYYSQMTVCTVTMSALLMVALKMRQLKVRDQVSRSQGG